MLQVFDTNKFGLHIFGTRNGINDLYFHNFGFDTNIPITQTNAIKNLTEAYGIHDMQSFFKSFPNKDEHYHIVFHDDLIGISTIGMISDASMNAQGVVQSRRQGHYGISLWFRRNLIPDSKRILDLLKNLKTSFENRFIDKNVGGILSYISFDGFESELPAVNSICSKHNYISKTKNTTYCTYELNDQANLHEVLEYILKYQNSDSIFITRPENVSNLNLGRINATDKISELRFKKSKRDVRVNLTDNNNRPVNATVTLIVDGQPIQPIRVNGSGIITFHNPIDNAQINCQITPHDEVVYSAFQMPESISLLTAVTQGLKLKVIENPYFEYHLQDENGYPLKSSTYDDSINNLTLRQRTEYYVPKLNSSGTLKLKARNVDHTVEVQFSRVGKNSISLNFPSDVRIENGNQELISAEPFIISGKLSLNIKVNKVAFPEKQISVQSKTVRPEQNKESSSSSFSNNISKPFSVKIKSNTTAECKLVDRNKGVLNRSGNTYSYNFKPKETNYAIHLC